MWFCLSLLLTHVNSLYDVSLQITETQMIPYKRGDIINSDIVIEERIDILGSTELVTMPVYHHADYSQFDGTLNEDNYDALDHQMLLDSGPQVLYIAAGLEKSDSGNNYLTLLKDERVKANSSCIRNQTYCLDELHFKGGHGINYFASIFALILTAIILGEVYRAHRISDLIINKNVSLILKRMFIKDRPAIERWYSFIHYTLFFSISSNSFTLIVHIEKFSMAPC